MTAWRTTVLSEREPDGTFEDCTWASAVMLANQAHGRVFHPQTRAEYEALRTASGDIATPTSPGSNTDDALRGMAGRYGWTPRKLLGWEDVDRLPVESAALVQGRAGSLPPRLRRGFMGAHAVCVIRVTLLAWWFLDPLAPQGYPGEPISTLELRDYMHGLTGARALAVTTGGRADLVDPTRDAPVALCDVTGTGPIFRDAIGTATVSASWAGGRNIQIYARPRAAAGRAACLFDMESGPGEQLIIGWISGSRVTNVRAIGAPDCAALVAQAIAATKASARVTFGEA